MKYEYKILVTDDRNHVMDIEAKLNELGALGYEVLYVKDWRHNSRQDFYLKRVVA